MTLEEQAVEVLKECSEKNWDGYGADPVNPLMLEAAIVLGHHIVSLLNIPEPELGTDPYGDGCLDWYTGWGSATVCVDCSPLRSHKYYYAAVKYWKEHTTQEERIAQATAKEYDSIHGKFDDIQLVPELLKALKYIHK